MVDNKVLETVRSLTRLEKLELLQLLVADLLEQERKRERATQIEKIAQKILVEHREVFEALAASEREEQLKMAQLLAEKLVDEDHQHPKRITDEQIQTIFQKYNGLFERLAKGE